MQVGDLVKLLDDPRVHMDNSNIGSESLGVVVEDEKVWSANKDSDRLGWRWVKWPENPDWDCMYVEDLELVSESR